MKVACPTLCDPVVSTVHGILQARILEWVAFPSSRGSSQPRSPTSQADSLPAEPADLPDPGIEPGSPAWQVDSLPTELLGKPTVMDKHN